MRLATASPPSRSSFDRRFAQRLQWDFKTTFPQPTQEALDAGLIPDEDTRPENIRAIHDEHARELLAVLHDLDTALDARRRGVDPRNNKAPTLAPAKERLQKFFETEPLRLERWWQAQMGVYEEAFGPNAADAFGKAIRAWHAGIEVTNDSQAKAVAMTTDTKPPTAELFPRATSRCERPRSIPARLPVPKPLASAIAAGHFGQEENGKPPRKSIRYSARFFPTPPRSASSALHHHRSQGDTNGRSPTTYRGIEAAAAGADS